MKHVRKISRRSLLRRKAMRQRVWKTLTYIVAVATIINVSSLTALAPQIATAGGDGAIWTTTGSCGNPQDANHYKVSDHIFINGAGFTADSYNWTITGKPGGASGDPNVEVASDTKVVDTSGAFCFDAYMVAGDDWGEYQVKFGNKGDNYRVDGVDLGSLVFTKVIDTGSASASDFTFTINPDPHGLGAITPSAGSTGTYTFEGLTPGIYNIVENSGLGYYHHSGNTCIDVVVTAGQQAACAIHNTRDVRPVTIIKNPVGGNAVPSDWTFNLIGTGPDQGTFNGIESGVPVIVPTGNYALSENGPAGYHFSDLDGNCYNDGGLFLYTNIEGGNTCTVTNAYDPTPPNLTISKTDNHTTALPGETLTYVITLTNNGDLEANRVKVDDTLPVFLSTPTDITDSGVFASGHIIWNNLSVPGHGSKLVSFRATISATIPAGTTVLLNEAVLSCGLFREAAISSDIASAQCPYSGSAIDETSVSTAPVLSLTKTASPTAVNPSSTVTYTVNWSVAGNSNVTGVVLTDPIPTNVIFVSANNGGNYTIETKTITWDLGTKTPGSSGSVSWVGQVTNNAPAGSIVNTAFIDSNETDPAIAASATIAVTIPATPQVLGVQSPNLTLTKAVNPTSTTPGQVVIYTLVVSNIGDGPATNVVITDTLPTGFAYVDGGGKTKTWTYNTLAASVSKTIVYQVKVGADVVTGQYTNHATAASDGLDPITAQATVTVKAPQVLGLEDTGVSARDYLIFGFGLILMAAGYILNQRSRRVQGSKA